MTIKHLILAILALSLSGCTSVRPSFESFVDELMLKEMEREGIPGAAFVFVRDGKIVYMKGYGVANVDTGRPVDPELTVWRIGSISKTFTSAAVVELASQGRIHLSGDVNSYLTSLEVPETYPLPITVADLLMHTSGLDEIRPGTQAPSAGEVLPLADFLRPRLVRIRPPGQVTAYSTYGITVAGALLEDVTGKTIESVLRELIWQPLGMTRTSIDASKNLDVAMGYERKGESLEPQAWEWYHTTPASSVNSTAADMARYMISLLEKDNSPLLRQHITMHPRLEGVTLGLFEGFVGDLRFVEHGGNVAGFSAQMTLIPSEHIGFFVVNHMEGSQLRNSVSYALIDHLYPAARQQRFVVPQPPPDFEQRAAAYTGRYVPMTGCVSCQPRSAPFVLEVSAERNMLVFNKRHWIEVEPLVFVSDDGLSTIVFRTDDQGRVSWLFSGGVWSFERLRD